MNSVFFSAQSFRTSNRMARAGYRDLLFGAQAWRIWITLAWNDIGRRYRRSKIGQFWLTLSMGVTVLGLGAVYSTLFNIDISAYLPYVAVTFVAWAFIAATITESCTAFIEAEGIIKHVNLPRSTHLMRVLTRNLSAAAHNVMVVPVVFLITGHSVNANVLWILLGLPLLVLNLLWMGCVLAIVCARYRDVPQIVASVVQILFFVTPVMFRPEQLGARANWAVSWNPFANLLEVVRDPFLGQPPSAWALAICTIMLVVGWGVTIPFIGRYAPRVPYWL